MLPIAERLYRIRKPLLIHAGWGSHGNYDLLLQKIPDLKLIFAHAGFRLYLETWNNIKKYKNVYIDLSQVSYLNDQMTKEAIDFLGVEKCPFGTDGPYWVHDANDVYDYSFIKRGIEKLFPDKGIQKKLLGEFWNLSRDTGTMLPPDELLIEELATPTYEVVNGKIRVMKEEDFS